MSVLDIARTTGVIARSAGSYQRAISAPRRHKPWSEGFYDPPNPLPPGLPGELLRAEPMHAYLIPGVRFRARAWRILYRSTGAVGEQTAVSGTLLMPPNPRTDGQPVPLVGFGVGTHGIGDSAAPSRLLSTGRDWEAGLMALVLGRGFAVAISDYQGLGTPGDHAYMVGQVLGRNVLDSIRAARRLLPNELPENGPAGLIGYSEGGAAAAWAAQLQPDYAPDVPLAGVAAGAAAADMELAGPRIDGTFFSFFLAYGAIGYAAAYPELNLDRYLTEPAVDTIEMLRESNVLQAAVRGPRFARADQLTDPNVLQLPQWRARLAENRLGLLAPKAPVLLHHARHDHIVSFSQSEQLLSDWAQLGADVRLYVTRGGFDHISGAVSGAPVAVDWLARRIERWPFGASLLRRRRTGTSSQRAA